MAVPSVTDIRATFDYDPCSGRLTWKVNRSHRVGCECGSVSPAGYRLVHWRGRNWQAHRLAWAIINGTLPSLEIDHVNGRRDDNRIGNLREVTSRENKRNSAISVANSSGVTGVHWHARREKWSAQIRVDYRNIHLGYFAHLEEATAARRRAEREFGFHAGHGRAAQDIEDKHAAPSSNRQPVASNQTMGEGPSQHEVR